jgi:hypothetical protein
MAEREQGTRGGRFQIAECRLQNVGTEVLKCSSARVLQRAVVSEKAEARSQNGRTGRARCALAFAFWLLTWSWRCSLPFRVFSPS